MKISYKKKKNVNGTQNIYMIHQGNSHLTFLFNYLMFNINDLSVKFFSDGCSMHCIQRNLNPFVTSGTYISHLQRVFSSQLG